MSSTVNKNIKYDDAKKPSEEKGNSDVKASDAKENTKLNNGNNKDRRDNSTNQSNNDSNKSNVSSTVNADKTEAGPKDSKDDNKTADTNNNQNNSGNTGGTGNVSNSNSNTGSNTSSGGSSSGNSGYSPSAPSNPDIIDSGTLTPSNDTVEFPEYSSVVSNNNTDVYSSLDSSYKIIINHDNNSVTSVEHYFDFGNPDKALSSLGKITQGYTGDMIKNIKCEGQYVKVIFKDSYFNTFSYNDFISKFDGFNKITK